MTVSCSFIVGSWWTFGGKRGKKGGPKEVRRPTCKARKVQGGCKYGARRVRGGCRDGARRVQGGCREGARRHQGGTEYGSKGDLKPPMVPGEDF